MARQAYTDEQILTALRAAAGLVAGPLSHGRYDALAHAVGGPSSARVIQRFGSWRRACEAAGVESGTPSRDYDRRWDRASVTDAVAQFLADEDDGTYAGYQSWAKGHSERPSGATVRNVLGSWNDAKAAARR